MLQSLLKKIKSEKSEAPSSEHCKGEQPTAAHAPSAATSHPHCHLLLGELQEVESDIPRIRYCAFPPGPSLSASILACPVSAFNQLPYARRKVKEIDLSRDPSPGYLDPLRALLGQELPEFNHLLVNVYPAGVGIMPHFDGPLYRPKVVVLSLGGPAVISFSDSYKNTNKVARLLLEDQSLHVFEEEAYVKHLHGIEEFAIDSVFLRVAFPEGQKPVIVRSSVNNFPLTRFHAAVIEKLWGWSGAEEMDLSEETKSKSCLLAIRQNEEYNFKIEIVRQERISLTVRQRINPASTQA